MQYHMPTNNNIVYVSIKTKWYALFLFYPNIFATIQTTAKKITTNVLVIYTTFKRLSSIATVKRKDATYIIDVSHLAKYAFDQIKYKIPRVL